MNANDFPVESSTVQKIERISNLSGEEIASRLRAVKTVGRVVWRSYQIIATLIVVCLISGYVALFNQEYRDLLLPYKSNVYTKSCRAPLGNGQTLEGTRTVYDRYQQFGPLHWVSKTEATETTKVALRGEQLTVIGMNESGELEYTKTFAPSEKVEQLKPTTKLVFVQGTSKPEVATISYAEFCK